MVRNMGLLGTITISEKRKQILFLLREHPMTLSEIKDHFHVRSPEIIPRLKDMIKDNVIRKDKNMYYITPIGKVLASHYRLLLDTISALETNKEILEDHDISSIPEDFLLRIHDLQNCRTVRYTGGHNYGSHEGFEKYVQASTRFHGVASIYLPTWVSTFLELTKLEMPISIVVTRAVYDVILKNDKAKLEEGLSYPNAHMYVLEGDLNLTFAVTDKFLSLSLCFQNGNYDPQLDLEGYDDTAIKWGKRLFDYYRERAIEVPKNVQVNELIYKKGIEGTILSERLIS